MVRGLVVEVEGPLVYKCKHCHTDLGVHSDIVSVRDGLHGKVYAFTRLFNMYLIPSTLTFVSDVLCVYCSAHLGSYYVSTEESVASTYSIQRRKLHGPEGSDDEA